MNEHEHDLLQRLKLGEAGAFAELVDRYAAGLLRLAGSLLGSRSDAEDVLQETLIGALNGIARFDGRSALKTWLTGILIRQAGKKRRTYRRMTIASEQFLESVPTRHAVGASVDARLDVGKMLAVLSPEHREVIALRELEGLSYDQIAQVLGVPRGTVESRLYRAREKLVEHFGGYLDG